MMTAFGSQTTYVGCAPGEVRAPGTRAEFDPGCSGDKPGLQVSPAPSNWTPVHTAAVVAGAAGLAWMVFQKEPWRTEYSVQTGDGGTFTASVGPEEKRTEVSGQTMALILAGLGGLFYLGYKLSPTGGSLTPGGKRLLEKLGVKAG